MATKIYLRLDKVTPEHITQTIFFNGANAGKLTLRHGEYQIFGAALLLAAGKMKPHLELSYDDIEHDSEGNFNMPEKRVVINDIDEQNKKAIESARNFIAAFNKSFE